MTLLHDGYVPMTIVALFAVMGILSLPPVFLAVTAQMSEPERRRIAFQTALAVAITMVVSYFVGTYILQLFKIDIDAFRVAGALVVASMAWGMITARPSALLSATAGSPAVIPLAIPKTAGPGAIAVIISMGANDGGSRVVGDILSVLLVTLIALAFMLGAKWIERVLGDTGLSIVNRIFGLLLLAIAITSIMSSLLAYFPGWAG